MFQINPIGRNDIERTKDVLISQDATFVSMLLTTNTLQGLYNSGFFKPSPIQLHGIPLGKCGFDLLLEAKSGTGKTAVFTVIALEKIILGQGLQAIILAPTREIAFQICDVIKQLGSKYEGLKVEVVMGGLPVEDDIAKFKTSQSVDIVVGSPGRLRHLIQDGHIDVSHIKLFVLDEADKLMEKSFLADINYIFSKSPTEKQVIMSSATYPENVKMFLKQYVKNAQHICPDTTNVLIGIEQRVTYVNCNSNVIKQTKLRYEELKKILSSKSFKQCLIFCNYQARVAELHKLLTRDKWHSEQLYGQQEQLDRLDALKTLQNYKCRILIATDLAARGIDASNVDLVVNFEPAYDWQTYLHRIGRAGRFGSYGIAITIVSIGKEDIQFKNTLSIMKDSLKIKYLWSEEVLQFETPISEVILPTTNNNTEIFNCKDIATPQEIEHKDIVNPVIGNFDEPDSSFDINLLIETFAELLKSYENSNLTHSEDIAYPTLDLKDVQSFWTFPNDSSCTPEMEQHDLNQHLSTELGSMHTEVAPAEGEKMYKKKRAITSKKGISNDSDETRSKIINEMFSDKSDNINLNGDSYEYVIDTSLHEEMMALGLPIEFSSSKEKNASESNIKTQNDIPNGDNHEYVTDSSIQEQMVALGLPVQFCSSKDKNSRNYILDDDSHEYVIDSSIHEQMAALGLPVEFCSSKDKNPRNYIPNGDSHEYVIDSSIHEQMAALGLPVEFCSSKDKNPCNKKTENAISYYDNSHYAIESSLNNEMVAFGLPDKFSSSLEKKQTVHKKKPLQNIQRFDKYDKVNQEIYERKFDINTPTEFYKSNDKNMFEVDYAINHTDENGKYMSKCNKMKYNTANYEYNYENSHDSLNYYNIWPNYDPNNLSPKGIHHYEKINKQKGDHITNWSDSGYEHLAQSNKYKEWFNQLKRNTKQMEMAYYIQGMSSM